MFLSFANMPGVSLLQLYALGLTDKEVDQEAAATVERAPKKSIVSGFTRSIRAGVMIMNTASVT